MQMWFDCSYTQVSGWTETYATSGQDHAEGYAQISGPNVFVIGYNYTYCDGSFMGEGVVGTSAC